MKKSWDATNWDEDCKHWWGKVLTGTFKHWCYEWDELPIDETCEEFESCTCFSNDDVARILLGQIEKAVREMNEP